MSWWPSNFSSSQMLVVLFWSTLLVLILGSRCQGYFTIKTLTEAPRRDPTTTRICLLWLVSQANVPKRRTTITTIQVIRELVRKLLRFVWSHFLCVPLQVPFSYGCTGPASMRPSWLLITLPNIVPWSTPISRCQLLVLRLLRFHLSSKDELASGGWVW